MNISMDGIHIQSNLVLNIVSHHLACHLHNDKSLMHIAIKYTLLPVMFAG